MATVEGLNLRGTRFYLRVLIPEDLQAAYGKTRVNLSLRTGDRATAVLNGLRAKAQWLEEFAAMRSANPFPILAAPQRRLSWHRATGYTLPTPRPAAAP
ncbi:MULTISPECIES: DUF6538 domain-containing protein [Comamonas]|uniref:DUF6538 domain-containing protein n=1 Tax=Comamonas TaxID=283 RepID=UPI00050DF2D1|nr:hypothetical protein P369_04290 [Comamonas thiooxydans]KGH01422.1 hypothetical protein P367_04495 [Comamonas thiooxydans]KGH15201.1 hypothetical protein P368_03495 [Comamonas thiooxydans]